MEGKVTKLYSGAKAIRFGLKSPTDVVQLSFYL